jgi:hypothetical protein
VKELRAARQRIAKSYSAEDALMLGNYDISAPTLGRALNRDEKLSGGQELVARFQQANPSVMREAVGLPPAGVSGGDVAMGLMLAAQGDGRKALASGLPLLRGPVRSLILSDAYQKAFAKVPKTPVDATPDKLAAAVRLLSQAAGGSEEATQFFAPAASMAPSPILSRP